MFPCYRFSRNLLLSCLLALSGSAVWTHVAAQDWPSRTVRIILPFAAGGSTDALARIIATGLTSSLGQPTIVENRPGAGGNLGVGVVARSAPDGYSLVIVATGFVVNPHIYSQVPYDPFKDFEPVINIASVPSLLAAHPSVPVSSVNDVIALSKKSPGKLNYASAGHGSHQHLAGELFRLNTGADVTHVPYNGGGAAVLALLGGQTELGILALPTARAHLDSGKLRAIAITSEKRSTASPGIPTFVESGFPGLEADQFMGILAPAGTPGAIIARLNTEIVKIVNAPDVRKRLEDLGFLVTGSSPEGFAETLKLETEKWSKVVKQAKIRVD